MASPLEEGSICKMLYDFSSKIKGELNLKIGDIVQLHKRMDKHWGTGSSNNLTGLFPLNMVVEISLPKFELGQQLFAALDNFFGSRQQGCLGFSHGDIIVGFHQIDENWWEGSCNGFNGMFPLTHVWKIDTTMIQLREKEKKTTFYVRVKMDLKAQLEEEMDLAKGEVVTVTEIIDKDWYRGFCDKRSGIIPAAFVVRIDDPPPATQAHQLPPLARTDSLPSYESLMNYSDINQNVAPKPLPQQENQIVPYATAMYDFEAQNSNELSVKEGEIVYLVRRTFDGWVECRVDWLSGLVPEQYLQIIVDIEPESAQPQPGPTSNGSQFNELNGGSIPACQKAVVLHDFQAQLPEDLSVRAGEHVFVETHIGVDWVIAYNEKSQRGMCPTNHILIMEAPDITERPSNTMRHSWAPPSSSLELSLKSNLSELTAVKPLLKPCRPPAISRSQSVSYKSISPVKSSPEVPPPPVMGPGDKSPLAVRKSVGPVRAAPLPPAFKRMDSIEERPATNSCSDDDISEKSPNKDIVDAKRPWSIRRRLSRSDDSEEGQKAAVDKRQLVVSELMQTERDYQADLRMCHDVFMADAAEGKKLGVAMNDLFQPVANILVVAEKFLRLLEKETVGNLGNQQRIGICFVDMSDELRLAYSFYCRNYDDIIGLLDKYDDSPEIKAYFRRKLESTGCRQRLIDLNSVLIKPVQRVLKYPLLLDQLIKYTPDNYTDRPTLIKALEKMTDVAIAVNEAKRRKELVDKYRRDEVDSFGSKMAKLNIHSVVKKSQRFSAKVSSSLGLMSVTRDDKFIAEEGRFHDLEVSIPMFVRNAQTLCAQLHGSVLDQHSISESFGTIFAGHKIGTETEEFRSVHREIVNIVWHDFKTYVDKRVFEPLNKLMTSFAGPRKLIDKRNDKLLDYDSANMRYEKNNETGKTRQFREDLTMSKTNYEALNSQLLEDLPKLTREAEAIFSDCIASLMYARRRYVGRVARIILPLMELRLVSVNPNSASATNAGAILEVYHGKHVESLKAFADLTLVPTGFGATSRKSGSFSSPALDINAITSPVNNLLTGGTLGTLGRKPKYAVENMKSQQSETHKDQIQKNYPANKIFVCIHGYRPTDVYDVALRVGDIVGVVKNSDPMGNSDRWYVDNGVMKGIAAAKCLARLKPSPTKSKPGAQPKETGASSKGASINGAVVSSRETGASVNGAGATSRVTGAYLKELEARGTPLVPKVQLTRAPDLIGGRYENSVVPLGADCAGGRYENTAAPPVPVRTDLGQQKGGRGLPLLPVVPNTQQENVYEYLADEENVYAAIEKSRTPSPCDFFYALYDFKSNNEHTLDLIQGQVVLVVSKCDSDGNTEWWNVRDRHGNVGFVPASYLSIYSDSEN